MMLDMPPIASNAFKPLVIISQDLTETLVIRTYIYIYMHTENLNVYNIFNAHSS